MGVVNRTKVFLNNRPKTVLTKLEFSRRLSQNEKVLIKQRSKTDDALSVFMDEINYAQSIDLSDAGLRQGLEHLETIGILTSQRVLEILTP